MVERRRPVGVGNRAGGAVRMPEAGAHERGGPAILILVLSRLRGRGGREVAIARLLPALRTRGASVALAILDHAADPAWEAGLPQPLLVGGIDPDGALRRHLPGTVSFVRRALRQTQPDAILVTEPLSAAVVRVAVAGLGIRRPAVFSWFHQVPRLLRYRGAMRCCDAHLAIGAEMARQVRRFSRRPAFVVRNPVGDPVPRPCPRPSDGIVHLVYVGRLHEEKRVDRVLDALSRVPLKNWRLQIVGDGALRGALESTADSLNLSDDITWSGWSAHPWREVKKASLVLLTSETEGFGLVLAEALARGIPVAALDCDYGPREIVLPGRNGWLLPPGDIGALAELIRGLCAGEIRLPDANAVVATARRFYKDAVAASMLEAIHVVTGRRGGLSTG